MNRKARLLPTGQTDARTDGQTPDRYRDPALHTVQAVSKTRQGCTCLKVGVRKLAGWAIRRVDWGWLWGGRGLPFPLDVAVKYYEGEN